jgi:hypothetical protein
MANEPRKKARELTTDEAAERVFGREAAEKLRQLAREHGRKPLKRKRKKRE